MSGASIVNLCQYVTRHCRLLQRRQVSPDNLSVLKVHQSFFLGSDGDHEGVQWGVYHPEQLRNTFNTPAPPAEPEPYS